MDRDQKKYFLHKIVGYSFFFKQEKKTTKQEQQKHLYEAWKQLYYIELYLYLL